VGRVAFQGKVGIRGSASAALAVAALALAPAAARAAAITVDSTADGTAAGHCTLNDAIDTANANATVATTNCTQGSGPDTISFDPAVTPAINLDAQLAAITESLTITGPGSDLLNVHAKPACACSLFAVQSPAVVSITGLEMSGARDTTTTAGGGALYVGNGATATLDLDLLDNNQVTGVTGLTACGGAIQNAATGTLTLTRSTVANNQITASGSMFAAARGGGVCNYGTLTADQDTINGNTAEANSGTSQNIADGGGVLNDGTMTLERSTIAGNTAETPSATGPLIGGGGFAQSFAGSAVLTSVTFANNTASDARGHTIEVETPGTLTIRNSILGTPNGVLTAGAAAKNCYADAAGILTSGGYNLEAGSTCGFAATSDQNDTLPLFSGGLDDNGGPTNTRALQATSPALDAGNSFGETIDQRGAGFARPLDFPAIATGPGDGADIGAVEMPGDPFTTPPPPPPPPTITAPGPTGRQAAALKKCKKKKTAKKRKKCRKKARKLPV
jgi:hypothetical protein